MEAISLTKKLLVAGGILVCGYIAYCIVRNREEELKQQEQDTEDAEFIIIVENEDSDIESKKEAVKTPLPKVEVDVDTSEKMTTKLSVVKNMQAEVITDKESIENLEMTSKEIEQTEQVFVVAKSLEADPQITKDVNDIEVVKPIEVTVATKEKVANDDFPLQLGSKGQRVWNLKAYMLRNHGASGIVTDDYDALTLERVKLFLKADKVTEQLYMRLNMDSSRKKKRNATKKKH